MPTANCAACTTDIYLDAQRFGIREAYRRGLLTRAGLAFPRGRGPPSLASLKSGGPRKPSLMLMTQFRRLPVSPSGR